MSYIRQFAERIKAPFNDKLVDTTGLASVGWVKFFGAVVDALVPLGTEKSFQIVNNTAASADIPGLSFNYTSISQVIVDFFIQRVTTGAGATEILTSGVFHLVYKPASNSWALVTMGTPGPSTSGITFSVTANGQVQYTSTNVTGTPLISKLSWRARTMAAKSSAYSAAVK